MDLKQILQKQFESFCEAFSLEEIQLAPGIRKVLNDKQVSFDNQDEETWWRAYSWGLAELANFSEIVDSPEYEFFLFLNKDL